MILESRFLSNPGIAIEQSKTAARKMAEQSKTALNLSFGLLDDFQEETAFPVEKIEAKVDRYEDELGTYLIKLKSERSFRRRQPQLVHYASLYRRF